MPRIAESALVLFDVDLAVVAEQRLVRLFLDGVYQEIRGVMPGDRFIAGMSAPENALVRVELLDSGLQQVAVVAFAATNTRKTISSPDAVLVVRILGDLFEAASAAAA